MWLKNLANWITPTQTKNKKEPFSLFCNCTKCKTVPLQTTKREPHLSPEMTRTAGTASATPSFK